MYTLLIDSHSNILTVAIYQDEKILDKIIEDTNYQSKMIIPKIQELLTKNNIEIINLNEIIVVNGPGSFTGVRLGVTVAKTLAYLLKIRIKSISSLQLKALSIDTNKKISTTVKDPKGYYVGEFNSNKELISDYFYLSNSQMEEYQKNNIVINDINIKWENIIINSFLTEENYYSIKPIYIKKIEGLNDKKSNY